MRSSDQCLMRRLASAVIASGLLVVLNSACAESTPYGQEESPVTKREPAKKKADPKETTASQTAGLTVSEIAPPSVKVGSAPEGLTVTIKGTGFDSTSKVKLAGETLPTTVGSATSLTATISGEKLKAAGGLVLSVAGPNATSNEVSLMVVTGSQAISKLSPVSTPVRAQGASGTFTLTVEGVGFQPASVVVFNGADVATQSVSATALRATVPSSLMVTPGSVNVTVRGAGEVTTPVVFTLTSGTNTSSSVCGGGSTCGDFGLSMFECTELDGAFIQCENDGCVYEGCE
jgi:hypothetical protein